MTVFQAVFLGLVQGLTEFLPVSSSGHLVLAQTLLGFKEPPVVFDILLHFGSLMAVFIFFRKILAELIEKSWFSLSQGKLNKIPPVVWAVVIGTAPAVIVGFILNGYIKEIFNSIRLVGATLMITAGFLFSTTLIKKSDKKIDNISGIDALAIGAMQAVAILPGVSRSGSTVVAGLWRKLDRESAFVFSFLLSIPAILGAAVLQIKDLTAINGNHILPNLVGFIVAIISSYSAIVLFKRFIIQGKLAYFGVYCLSLGIVTLLLVK